MYGVLLVNIGYIVHAFKVGNLFLGDIAFPVDMYEYITAPTKVFY